VAPFTNATPASARSERHALPELRGRLPDWHKLE
jgi:hypothetical protein